MFFCSTATAAAARFIGDTLFEIWNLRYPLLMSIQTFPISISLSHSHLAARSSSDGNKTVATQKSNVDNKHTPLVSLSFLFSFALGKCNVTLPYLMYHLSYKKWQNKSFSFHFFHLYLLLSLAAFYLSLGLHFSLVTLAFLSFQPSLPTFIISYLCVCGI